MKPIAVIALMIGAVLTTACDVRVNTDSGRGFELINVTDLSVNPAQTETVTVIIDRKGGYDGPVSVDILDLPPGVTIEGGSQQTIVAKDSKIQLKLIASEGAAPGSVNRVTIKTSANVDGTTLAKQSTFNLKIKAKG